MDQHTHDVPPSNVPHFGSRKGVPGRVEVEIRVFQEGEPDYDARGMTLAALRDSLGGNEGFVTEPFRGDPIKVSLLPWAHVDFETARFELRFKFKPDLPIAPEHAHLFPHLHNQ